MAKKDYSKARATKKKSGSKNLTINIDESDVKNAVKSAKKSPIILVALFALLAGAVGGFFAFNYFCKFEMNNFSVWGEVADEVDYVVLDVSALKEKMLAENSQVTMEQIYSNIEKGIVDEGVECKFFGMDAGTSVNVSYSYREDISHDAEKISKIDVSRAGVYYIEYTSSHFAFRNKTLIRTVIVMGVENDG